MDCERASGPTNVEWTVTAGRRFCRFRAAATALIALIVAPTLVGERLPVRTLTTADGLPRDQLACVRSDPRGFVWFCTAEGLVRFDGEVATTFGRGDGLVSPGVRSFLMTGDGRYWTGADAGLFEFRPAAPDASRRFRPVVRDDGRPTGAINGLAESRDHSVWCAAGRGLYRVIPSGDGFRMIEVDIGLPNQTESDRIVRAVLEDEHGTLWVGAGSGLYQRRPDGQTTRVTTSDGLPVNEVKALAIDKAGRLWAGTREGLSLLDRDAVDARRRPIVRRVYTTADGLPENNVPALFADGDTLWVGTVVGVVETALKPAGELIVGRMLTGFYAWAIASDSHGDIWIATEAGARRLTRRGFTTFTEEDGLAVARVSSMFESGAGTVCATTLVRRLELSCFDGRRFQPVPVHAASSRGDPGWGWSQLTLQDRQGRWWIPTGEGLLQFAAGPAATLAAATPMAIYDMRRGLRSNDIFRLFEDAAGGVWVATFAEAGNGLARIEPRTGVVRSFGPEHGLPDPLTIVHAFAEDRGGNIWIGLEEGQLLRYRAERFERIAVHDRVGSTERPYDHLRSLLADRQGRLWIASTVSGLGRLDDPLATKPIVRWYGMQDGLSSSTVWMLVEHGSGDLFIGTGRGIDRFDPVTERIVHYSAEDGVPRGEIWGALRDRSGQIWFATTAGAARLAAIDEPLPVAPVTLVTAIRVDGTPLPMAADGAARVDGITIGPPNRRIEIEFVSPGARQADGLRYQHQLEGVDREWTTTEGRIVALAGAAPGRYRFLVRAALAGGVAGEAARVEFTVLAPVWQRGWFVALMASGVCGIAFMFHRARVNRLVEVERVRSRIAADLHDGVGASLSRIAILSEVVRQQAQTAMPDAVPALAAIGDNAREVIDDMSDAVWFIDPRPDTLQQVVVRVRAMASAWFDGQHTGWDVDAPEGASAIALTPEQRRHLYLILKEALTNVLRHAQASHVSVLITASKTRLHLEIADDGIGLDVNGPRSTAGSGRGLGSMRTRAESLTGTLTVSSGGDRRGTRILVEVPRGRPHDRAVGAPAPRR